MQNRQNPVSLADVPNSVMHHMMGYAGQSQFSYASTSKQAAKVTSTNPANQKTITIGDFVFNELLYQKLIPSYISIWMDRKTGKIEAVLKIEKEELYDNPALVCKMMEDKGFHQLIQQFRPDEDKSYTPPSMARRIAQGALGGVVALISSAITICLLYPIALFGRIFCGANIRFLGLIFSPLCLLYSPVRSAHANARPSCRKVKLKDILLSSIWGSILMMEACLFVRSVTRHTGYDITSVDLPFENRWDEITSELGVLYNSKKTLRDIASEWRKKHPKPSCMLPVPPKSKPTLCNAILRKIMKPSQKPLLSYSTEDQTSYGSVYSTTRTNDPEGFQQSSVMQLGL